MLTLVLDPLLHEGITSAGGAGGAAGGTGNWKSIRGATIGAEYGVNFGMSTTDAEQLC